MGCGSSNEKNEPNEPKVSNESNTSKDSNSLEESLKRFRQEEISLINEEKEKLEEEIKNGIEEGGDILYPLYRKLDLDLTQKFFKLKEYFVIYIPSDFSKNSKSIDVPPPINILRENIDFKDLKHNKHYCKINGSPKKVKNFECMQDPENFEYDDYIRKVEIEISSEDKEKNLIIMETGYNIKFYNKLGLYNLNFNYSDDFPPFCSFSLTVDDNYIICHPYKEYFQEISKYKLYAFKQDHFSVTLKDKRIKINIENELDKELLSNFSAEEIKQINISLNKIIYHYDFRHLIYQKVVHNIKEDGKDYIKIYDIVYYPHPPGSSSGVEGPPIKSPQTVIVKRFKVNNLLVPKKAFYKGYGGEDEEKLEVSYFEEDQNEEGYEPYEEGYYISSHNLLGFYTYFSGSFALFEFDCVSNERLDYLPFDCNDIGQIDKNIIYGASFKYEIILNGHKVKFSNENLDYSVKNGKIIVQGMIDGNIENYDIEKYEELARKQKLDFFIDAKSEDSRMDNWAELRLKEFIPKTMKLV